tara:strand:+ start:1970 stop:2185 length:216 start_codon:yes stop_codon:yes gene_type:complete
MSATLIYNEYKRAISPILDHFEDASFKSLRLKQGNMLTPEEYLYIDTRIAEAESMLKSILREYEELLEGEE